MSKVDIEDKLTKLKETMDDCIQLIEYEENTELVEIIKLFCWCVCSNERLFQMNDENAHGDASTHQTLLTVDTDKSTLALLTRLV